jgi:hypothetical protein
MNVLIHQDVQPTPHAITHLEHLHVHVILASRQWVADVTVRKVN